MTGGGDEEEDEQGDRALEDFVFKMDRTSFIVFPVMFFAFILLYFILNMI